MDVDIIIGILIIISIVILIAGILYAIVWLISSAWHSAAGLECYEPLCLSDKGNVTKQ